MRRHCGMLPKSQPFEVLFFFLHFFCSSGVKPQKSPWRERRPPSSRYCRTGIQSEICFGRSSWSTLLLITETSELNLKHAIMRERATAHLWDLSSLDVIFPFLNDVVEVSDRPKKIGQSLQWLRKRNIFQVQLIYVLGQ